MSAPQGSGGNAAKTGMTVGLVVAIVGAVACMGVAFIGILAAIAIPNFVKFQCASKQSEAKVNLSGLFTAQKVFYGEYGFYTSDLVSIDWAPNGSPVYVYGFAEEGPFEDELPRSVTNVPKGYDPSRKDTANAAVISAAYATAKMRDLNGKVLTGANLPQDSWADESGFVAAAVGDIDPDSAPGTYDVWTIDEQRNLQVLENDCTN